MGKFNASHSVSQLDYDLNPYVMAKGRVPEPSDQQMVRFQKAAATHAQKYMPDVDPNDTAAVLEAMAGVDEEEAATAAGEMAEIVSELTNGKPSAEEMLKMPPRIRAAFYSWLNGELSPQN